MGEKTPHNEIPHHTYYEIDTKKDGRLGGAVADWRFQLSL